MAVCGHPHCSSPKIKSLDKAHNFLCAKSGVYHNWHHHRHHKKVHWAILTVHTVLVLSIVFANLFGSIAYASNSDWDFSAGSFGFSDENLVEVAGGAARLKVRENEAAGTSALYHFNDNVSDSSENSNNGTLTGTGSYGAGQLNNALTLNGTTEFVSVPAPAQSSLALTGSHSIEAWTKFPSAFSASSNNSNLGIVDKGDYKLYYDSTTGKINYELANQSNWAKLGGTGQSGSWNKGTYNNVVSQAVIGSNLYVGLSGTSNDDREVWKWDAATSVWSKIGGDGLGWSGGTTGPYLYSSGTDLYAAVEYKLWKKTGDAPWVLMNSTNFDAFARSIAVMGTDVYVGLDSSDPGCGVLMKYDGNSWQLFGGGGITSWDGAAYRAVTSLATDGTNLFAGLQDYDGAVGVWKWNAQDDWIQVGGDGFGGWNYGMHTAVRSMVINGDSLYAALDDDYNSAPSAVYQYIISGNTWSTIGGSEVNGSWSNSIIYNLTNNGDVLYASVPSDGWLYDAAIWKFESGAWTQILTGNPFSTTVDYVSYSTSASKLYATGMTSYGTGFGASNVLGAFSYDGNSFTHIGGQYTNKSWGYSGLDQVISMTSYNGKLYAGTGALEAGDGQVWEYADGGSWQIVGGQGVNASWLDLKAVYALIPFRGELYAGVGGTAGQAGVWKWSGTGSWTKVGGDGTNASWDSGAPAGTDHELVKSLATDGTYLYAGLGSGNGDAEVWKYDKDANSWSTNAIGGDGRNSSWTTVHNSVNSMVAFGGNLYIGLGSDSGEAEVWKWTGSAWSKIADGEAGNWGSGVLNVNTLIAYNNSLYAGIAAYGKAEVWKYSGTASNWTKVGDSFASTYEGVRSLVEYNGNIYAALGDTDSDSSVWEWNGTTWTKIGDDNNWSTGFESANGLCVYSGKLMVGLGATADDARVYTYGSNAILSSTTVGQDDAWHHIAATYNASTRLMSLYIDGSLDTSKTLTGAPSLPDSAKSLLIGTTYGSSSAGITPGFANLSFDELVVTPSAKTSFYITKYSNERQHIAPTASVLTSQVKGWTGFTHTVSGGGEVTYQLSHDNGGSWEYYSGGWTSAGDDLTKANTQADVAAHIADFPVTSGGIRWQAILYSSTGNDPVSIDIVRITYDEDITDPENPNSASGFTQNGGSSLTSGTTWTNALHPYFTWTGATDTDGSGVEGYYVYFGTNPEINPENNSGFINSSGTAAYYTTSTNVTINGTLVDDGTYYLLIKTKDKAQNVSDTAANLFTFKLDKTAPTNPPSVAASPSNWSATNDFTFLWTAGSDNVGGSGLSLYEYKVNSGEWTSNGTDTSKRLTGAASEGVNTFYLRTKDTAGNYANPIQVNFFYNSTAPGAPGTPVVTPAGTTADNPAEENNFSFTWTEPESHQADILEYYYSINQAPAANNVTKVSTTSLVAGPYATSQAPTKNTLYVVAKDTSGRINYGAYSSVDFYVRTEAPGAPLNVEAFDTSNKDLGKYRVSIEWSDPLDKGVGFAGYDIYRSTNGTNYVKVGSTAGNSYSDSSLQSIQYYYYVLTRDNAGQVSVSSSVVAITPEGVYKNPPVLVQNSLSLESAAFSAQVQWETKDAQDPEQNKHLATGSVVYSQSESDLTDVDKRSIVSEDADVLTAEHALKMTGLQPETTYHYQLKWKDANGNIGSSEVYSFLTEARPKISDYIVSNISLTSATISYKTNYPATTQLRYGKSSDNLSQSYDDISGYTTNHTINLEKLDHTSKYYVKIIGQTVNQDPLDSGIVLDFSTLTKPFVTSFSMEQVPDMPVATWRVAWTTNVETTGVVEYQRDGGNTQIVSDATYVKDHSATLSNLADKSNYTIRIGGNDKNGNAVDYSEEVARQEFKFNTPKDSRPPKVTNMSVEIRSSGVSTSQKAQLVVSWETDEPATSQVEYGPGISSDSYPSRSLEDATKTTSHVVIVSELDPAKLYHLRAVSRDESGNIGKSVDTTAITGKIQKSVIDLIINSLERSLSFLSKFPFVKR